MLRKILTPLSILLTLAWAAPVAAQDRPVVIELYTSQGCSSCPPADALLHDLAKRDGVIALALHVDYWDYIGWKDIFGDPAHAKRQRKYAKAWGERMIYTPQMVIGGTDGVVGNKPRDVNALIAKHKAQPETVDLKVARRGQSVKIKARVASGLSLSGAMDVFVARFDPQRTVDIRRGENAGRTLSYANIVTDLRDVGDWTPDAPLSLEVPVKGDGPVAVFVQRKGAGPIEAARVLR